MPRFSLSHYERQLLIKWRSWTEKRHRGKVDYWKRENARVRVLLAAADPNTVPEIAEVAKVAKNSVRRILRGFAALGTSCVWANANRRDEAKLRQITRPDPCTVYRRRLATFPGIRRPAPSHEIGRADILGVLFQPPYSVLFATNHGAASRDDHVGAFKAWEEADRFKFNPQMRRLDEFMENLARAHDSNKPPIKRHEALAGLRLFYAKMHKLSHRSRRHVLLFESAIFVDHPLTRAFRDANPNVRAWCPKRLKMAWFKYAVRLLDWEKNHRSDFTFAERFSEGGGELEVYSKYRSVPLGH